MVYQPAFPVGIPTYAFPHGETSYTKGQDIAPMVHPDWDMILVQEGEIIWEYKDGTNSRGVPGEFMILPPFVTVHRPPPKVAVKYLYCHFTFRTHPALLTDPKSKYPIAKIVHQDSLGPGGDTLIPLHFSQVEAPGILAAYKKLFNIKQEYSDRPWRFERAILEIITELAAFANRRKRNSKTKSGSFKPGQDQDYRIRQLCYRIDEEPEQDWRIYDVAKSYGISTGHLHLLCRKNLGKSLKEYLIEARLKKALQLLKERDSNGGFFSVKDVSLKCGFRSQHFFARQFKKNFQLTPLHYRKSILS